MLDCLIVLLSSFLYSMLRDDNGVLIGLDTVCFAVCFIKRFVGPITRWFSQRTLKLTCTGHKECPLAMSYGDVDSK